MLACVVLKPGQAAAPDADDPIVRALFDHCNAALAYYKAPGWLWFTDAIPTTGTQKVQKHQIFAKGARPTLDARDDRPSRTQAARRGNGLLKAPRRR